jgi:hypothetical protein
VIAIDLAQQMLRLRPNTYALVVSTENITQNMYNGTQRSMLIPNVIFRVGGAAMLLTNKSSEAWRAKYKLAHVVRTTLASNDDAFHCVMEMEDSQVGAGGRRLILNSQPDVYLLHVPGVSGSTSPSRLQSTALKSAASAGYLLGLSVAASSCLPLCSQCDCPSSASHFGIPVLIMLTCHLYTLHTTPCSPPRATAA